LQQKALPFADAYALSGLEKLGIFTQVFKLQQIASP